MDYFSVTTSEMEWRASICLCGMRNCRSTFLHYATMDDLQQVLTMNCGALWRYSTLLRSCSYVPVSEDDKAFLCGHGMGETVFGFDVTASRNLGLDDSVKRLSGERMDVGEEEDDIATTAAALEFEAPVGKKDWILKYASDNLRFIEYERRALPMTLMRSNSSKQPATGGIKVELGSNTLTAAAFETTNATTSNSSEEGNAPIAAIDGTVGTNSDIVISTTTAPAIEEATVPAVPSATYSFTDADMEARSVMEQRIQSFVCCYSMLRKVISAQPALASMRAPTPVISKNSDDLNPNSSGVANIDDSSSTEMDDSAAGRGSGVQRSQCNDLVFPLRALHVEDAVKRVINVVATIPLLLQKYIVQFYVDRMKQQQQEKKELLRQQQEEAERVELEASADKIVGSNGSGQSLKGSAVAVSGIKKSTSKKNLKSVGGSSGGLSAGNGSEGNSIFNYGSPLNPQVNSRDAVISTRKVIGTLYELLYEGYCAPKWAEEITTSEAPVSSAFTSASSPLTNGHISSPASSVRFVVVGIGA